MLEVYSSGSFFDHDLIKLISNIFYFTEAGTRVEVKGRTLYRNNYFTLQISYGGTVKFPETFNIIDMFFITGVLKFCMYCIVL